LAGILKFLQDSCEIGRNLATEAGRRRIPAVAVGFRFTPLVIFSYEPNAKKYFQKNHFFFEK
jgi:hypothetical protein